MGLCIMKRVSFLGAVAVGMLASQCDGVQLTYDLRATGGTAGVVIQDDGKTAVVPGPGAVVTVALYARLNDNDENIANDGFKQAMGSFVSSNGGLLGNVQNVAVAPNFQGPGFTAGLANATAFDDDGDTDWGSTQTTGTLPSPNPFFAAINAAISGSPGEIDDPATGDTLMLLGGLQFNVTAADPSRMETTLTFVPRLKTDGSITQQQLHLFALDGGALLRLRADSAELATTPIRIVLIPEPSSLILLGLGALGLLGYAVRRRS